jgi:hypothetical protein
MIAISSHQICRLSTVFLARAMPFPITPALMCVRRDGKIPDPSRSGSEQQRVLPATGKDYFIPCR